MPGHPQALLRAVIVVQVRVRADGHPTAQIVRSPDAALSRVALDTLTRTQTLPRPPAALAESLARVGYTETWLFNTDGRFQIRTVAPTQSSE